MEKIGVYQGYDCYKCSKYDNHLRNDGNIYLKFNTETGMYGMYLWKQKVGNATRDFYIENFSVPNWVIEAIQKSQEVVEEPLMQYTMEQAKETMDKEVGKFTSVKEEVEDTLTVGDFFVQLQKEIDELLASVGEKAEKFNFDFK